VQFLQSPYRCSHSSPFTFPSGMAVRTTFFLSQVVHVCSFRRLAPLVPTDFFFSPSLSFSLSRGSSSARLSGGIPFPVQILSPFSLRKKIPTLLLLGFFIVTFPRNFYRCSDGCDFSFDFCYFQFFLFGLCGRDRSQKNSGSFFVNPGGLPFAIR